MNTVFTPRIHENGLVCCSNPTGLCDKCKAHFAKGTTTHHHRAAQFRAAAAPIPPATSLFRSASDRGAVPEAPDPYAAGLARRAEIRAAQTPDLTEGYHPRGLPPNSWAMAVALRTALAQSDDVEPSPVVMHESGVPDSYTTALRKVMHGHN